MNKVLKTVGLGAVVAGMALATGSGIAFGQAAPGADTSERIATQAKPAVVRVFSGCRANYRWVKTGKVYEELSYGAGSGFFVNPNGYIATNAHVVEYSKDPATCEEDAFLDFVIELAKDNGIDTRTLTNEQARNLINNARQGSVRTSFSTISFVRLPNGTDLPFEIKTYGAPAGEGKDVSVLKVETRNAPVLKFADSDDVRLQETLLAAGYPGAANSRVLASESSLEATFTDGRVSARKTAKDGSPILQITNALTSGNSGGPVMNMKGEVVGMATFVATNGSQQVAGISFAVASNTVMEFVRQAGTTNEDGPVDRAFREGLDLYWSGKYTPAIAKFEEVRQLFPNHAEAQRFIQLAREAIANGKEVKPSPTPAPAPATPAPAAPAPVTPGNGGAIVSPKGEASGINSMVIPVGAISLFAGALGIMAAAGRKLTSKNRAPAVAAPATHSGTFCASCGGTIRNGARFCPTCGTPHRAGA